MARAQKVPTAKIVKNQTAQLKLSSSYKAISVLAVQGNSSPKDFSAYYTKSQNRFEKVGRYQIFIKNQSRKNPIV